MDQEVKKLWIEALLSKKYRQGRDYLRTTDKDGEFHYCCLGVLCDLYAQKVGGRWNDEEYGGFFVDEQGVSNNVVLPQGVVKWAGLSDSCPTVPKAGFLAGAAISAFNDGFDKDGGLVITPHSFEEIAKLIEEHL